MKNARSRIAVLAAALLPLAASAGAALAGTAADPAKEAASTPPAAAAPATAQRPARPGTELPPPSAMETQTGIQVARVGLTASGGLVDVRFKVLDAAKARTLLADPANAPMLVAGDKPPLMAPHNALKGARFSKGQVFFILFPNVRSAVQAGAPVTVAMGPVRLGPVTAR